MVISIVEFLGFFLLTYILTVLGSYVISNSKSENLKTTVENLGILNSTIIIIYLLLIYFFDLTTILSNLGIKFKL